MRSVAFFPVLVSTVGIGLTFQVADAPDRGCDQPGARVRRASPDRRGWSTRSGRCSRSPSSTSGRAWGWPPSSTSPASCPSRGSTTRPPRSTAPPPWQSFRNITLPLAKPATVSVIILSLIGGLRSFDLIWAMTKGGPGFTSDVIASVIYKQYQAGFYGLSTAGNVVLFLLVILIVVPAVLVPQPEGRRRMSTPDQAELLAERGCAIVAVRRRLPAAVRVHHPDRGQDPAGVGAPGLLLADRLAVPAEPAGRARRPATTS